MTTQTTFPVIQNHWTNVAKEDGGMENFYCDLFNLFFNFFDKRLEGLKKGDTQTQPRPCGDAADLVWVYD